MLERLKGLWTTHKKLCYLGIAFVISVLGWVVLGQDIDPNGLVNQACQYSGDC